MGLEQPSFQAPLFAAIGGHFLLWKEPAKRALLIRISNPLPAVLVPASSTIGFLSAK
jgi:hypothetical protein